jgi:hypothetical protein
VLIEVFVTADHGSTAGYEEAGPMIRARLNRPWNTSAVEWGIGSLQESVRVFAALFCEMTARGETRPEALFQIAAEGLRRFVYRPTREEARAFGPFQFSDDQTESSFSPLVPDWRVSMAWRAVFQKRLRPSFWWHEGFLALRPSFSLRRYLALYNLKERCYDLKRSRALRQYPGPASAPPDSRGSKG